MFLEESHYYPFGLTMAGISSKALSNAPRNRYKFNSGTELAEKEFSDDSGLQLYETPFRRYDAQIGRFHHVDPLSELADSWSPYVYCLNNPILLNDPLGLIADTTINGVSLTESEYNSSVTVTNTRSAQNPIDLQYNSPTVRPVTVNLGSGIDFNNSVTEIGLGGSVVVVNPQALVLGGGAALAYGLWLGLTADYNNTVPSITMPGFSARDNTTYRPPIVLNPARDVPVPPFTISPPAPHGEQYTLRARASGWYPKYSWGKGQTASIWLNKGEIWKIGTTINGTARYSNFFYSTVGSGLDYVGEFGPAPMDQVLFVERMKQLNYVIQHNGELPPGNTKLQ